MCIRDSKDVILVLDISGSMFGDKLNKVKSDAKELTEFLLSDQENRVALITFDSISSIEYELTNNKDELLSKIGSLTDTGCTNYNQALINVDKVLEGYEKKNNRDLVVLFLTDGYPNEETIEKDIENNEAYVLEEDGVILGTCMVTIHGEPAYNRIEGKWILNCPYICVHRLSLIHI